MYDILQLQILKKGYKYMNKPLLTDKDIGIIVSLYKQENKSADEISKQTGISKERVIKTLENNTDFKIAKREKTFVDDELCNKIIELYKTNSVFKVAKILQIPINTIRYVVYNKISHNVHKTKKHLKVDKKEFEKKLKKYSTISDAMEITGLSSYQLSKFLQDNYGTKFLSLVKQMIGLEELTLNSRYTPEEDEFILKNYKKLGVTKVAKHLNRTNESVYGRYCRAIKKLNTKGLV